MIESVVIYHKKTLDVFFSYPGDESDNLAIKMGFGSLMELATSMLEKGVTVKGEINVRSLKISNERYFGYTELGNIAVLILLSEEKHLVNTIKEINKIIENKPLPSEQINLQLTELIKKINEKDKFLSMWGGN